MRSLIKTAAAIAALLLFLPATSYAQRTEETGFNMPKLNAQSPLAELTGSHVGIRVPDYQEAIEWYTKKLDFRIIHQWDYADEKLAYLAPPNTNEFWIEILAGGKLTPNKKFADLGESLGVGGYHHICMHVKDLDKVIAELKNRGVPLVGEPFYLETISRRLAFIQDPWGNMIELSEIVKK